MGVAVTNPGRGTWGQPAELREKMASRETPAEVIGDHQGAGVSGRAWLVWAPMRSWWPHPRVGVGSASAHPLSHGVGSVALGKAWGRLPVPHTVAWGPCSEGILCFLPCPSLPGWWLTVRAKSL